MQNTPPANLIETTVHDLQPGMYVAELDRPWLETPFMVQGFFIHSEEDIRQISEHCSLVYVDPRRSTRGLMSKDHHLVANPIKYNDRVSMRDEFIRVENDFASATSAIEKAFDKLRTSGQLDTKALARAIDPLIESVLRNKDAVAALSRMRKKGEYIYEHGISTAVWAAVLGRHLGLDRETLATLVLGAAILDIGKVKIRDDLLKKPEKLSHSENLQMRKHVAFGIAILERSGEHNQDILDMVAMHHERFNGSGYPEGLSGSKIPLFARIVGIADSYDAMITPRPYASARSSFETVQELSDLGGTLFQKELIEQFVQAIGVFPTGSVVLFNTDEVGIVVGQNSTRRLKPKVVVILDKEKNKYPEPVIVDLQKYATEENEQHALWIVKELKSDAYGINPHDYYL